MSFGNHVKKFGSNFNQDFSLLSKSNLKCLFVSDTKTAYSLKVSKTCFSLDEKYRTIIPEIKIFFVCPLVGLMYENSLYDFKDPKFLIQ